jgi:two-component system NtrC family sensor kinase
MRFFSGALKRGRVSNFSRNSYEVLFSVFMVAVAYLYRNNSRIVYPTILYFFLLLMGSNFIFNQLLRKRLSVSLWAIDFILLFNLSVITGVLYYSGGAESYFWVLYLLPIFASAMLGNIKDVSGVVLLCALASALFSWPLHAADLAEVMSLLVKLSVFLLSAAAVYRSAEAKKKAETALMLKRGEVELMTRELLTKDTELVQTASEGEIGRLYGGIMHDLGNSVSIMLLSAQIASEDETVDKKDLERIVKAGQFSKNIISNALNILRGQDYIFAPGDMREPLENAVQLVNYEAVKKSAVVKVELPPDLPQVNMSKVHLERLFVNTLSNSLSFIPQNGEVTVKAARSGAGITVEISDNGPGFPESILKEGIKAFRTTRKEAGGTGLGLYICAQIAEKHGGRLSISNRPSGGSVVKITLPVK